METSNPKSKSIVEKRLLRDFEKINKLNSNVNKTKQFFFN